MDPTFNVPPSSFLDTYSLSMSHLWDGRPYTSTSVFLFSDQFVKVLPSPTLRIGLKYRTKGKVKVFVAASHQTRLDTRSKARRPIKVRIKGRGGRERAETRTLLVCAAHRLTLVQCEPDEASSFTNPNVGPCTYASLRLKLDAWSSAVQGGQRGQKMQLAHPKVA